MHGQAFVRARRGTELAKASRMFPTTSHPTIAIIENCKIRDRGYYQDREWTRKIHRDLLSSSFQTNLLPLVTKQSVIVLVAMFSLLVYRYFWLERWQVSIILHFHPSWSSSRLPFSVSDSATSCDWILSNSYLRLARFRLESHQWFVW